MKNLMSIAFLCVQFLFFAQDSTPSSELINGINLQNELIQNSIV